jgi:hypothetical protein
VRGFTVILIKQERIISFENLDIAWAYMCLMKKCVVPDVHSKALPAMSDMGPQSTTTYFVGPGWNYGQLECRILPKHRPVSTNRILQ